MKKFWEKYKAAILAFLLALIGAEGTDFAQTASSAKMTPDSSESLKQGADVPDGETTVDIITFELTFYAKQRGTTDNIRLEETFQAEKLPPLEDVMKAATIPEGYEASKTLPVFIKEIRREKRVIEKPKEEKPDKLPPVKKEAETE